MPTPARRATASRLASAPPALNTAFAASSTRSRLRTASTRGFRAMAADDRLISLLRVPLVTGGTLRIYERGKRRVPPFMPSPQAAAGDPRRRCDDVDIRIDRSLAWIAPSPSPLT